jgi:hypothetical protein
MLTTILQLATKILARKCSPKLINHLKRIKDVSPPRIGGPGGLKRLARALTLKISPQNLQQFRALKGLKDIRKIVILFTRVRISTLSKKPYIHEVNFGIYPLHF